jgi:hypothetical protein
MALHVGIARVRARGLKLTLRELPHGGILPVDRVVLESPAGCVRWIH